MRRDFAVRAAAMAFAVGALLAAVAPPVFTLAAVTALFALALAKRA